MIISSLSTWLRGIIGQGGGASGGARSSDVKLIGKSVTRPRRSSLLLASGKREDPVIIFEDEEDGEELLRQITRK